MWHTIARFWLSYLTLNAGLHAVVHAQESSASTVVAMVGQDKITEAEFQLFCAIRNVAPEMQADNRELLLSQLIERQLVRQALARRKIIADQEEVAEVVAQVEERIRKKEDDPKDVFQRIGLTKAMLEKELSLPIAWQKLVRQSVTDNQIVKYFEKHQAELDGTKVRASQIMFLLPEDRDELAIDDHKSRLEVIRKDVLAKKISFPEAAKKYSESPTKKHGGDVGWFGFRGKMPAAFSDVAFRLKVGEISEPVVSPFGVHLIQVTDRQPGELTLEDVRRLIIGRIADELWEQTAKAERATSKVTVLAPHQ